jgi:hypothetical protein
MSSLLEKMRAKKLAADSAPQGKPAPKGKTTEGTPPGTRSVAVKREKADHTDDLVADKKMPKREPTPAPKSATEPQAEKQAAEAAHAVVQSDTLEEPGKQVAEAAHEIVVSNTLDAPGKQVAEATRADVGSDILDAPGTKAYGMGPRIVAPVPVL